MRVEVDLVVGTVPLLALLDSVDLSVRKLALDRLRKSLRKEGAMANHCRSLSVNHNHRCFQLIKRTYVERFADEAWEAQPAAQLRVFSDRYDAALLSESGSVGAVANVESKD